MPRESLDAPENLPKQALGQVAFGQLEDEVPSMPDEASAGHEQPLLETRQGPAGQLVRKYICPSGPLCR